jgi:predicted nucleotidyltransferase
MSDAGLLERLRQALHDGPKLRLALLFGSHARNQARADSDVDVAILPADSQLALADELALQARLSSAAAREVDLVRLDHCYPAIRWRVANEGVLLLADPAFEASRFRARAGIEHADYAPQLRRAAEQFRRSVAQGRGAHASKARLQS